LLGIIQVVSAEAAKITEDLAAAQAEKQSIQEELQELSAKLEDIEVEGGIVAAAVTGGKGTGKSEEVNEEVEVGANNCEGECGLNRSYAFFTCIQSAHECILPSIYIIFSFVYV
jgi:hypothetical protein